MNQANERLKSQDLVVLFWDVENSTSCISHWDIDNQTFNIVSLRYREPKFGIIVPRCWKFNIVITSLRCKKFRILCCHTKMFKVQYFAIVQQIDENQIAYVITPRCWKFNVLRQRVEISEGKYLSTYCAISPKHWNPNNIVTLLRCWKL